MTSMDFAANRYRSTLPEPDGTPLGNLRHVVAAFAGSLPNALAIQATANIYGDGDPGVITRESGATFTGLTHGDLRELLVMLTPEAATDGLH